MKVGVQLLERAVELDPTFAEAHASLATAYARWYRQGFGTAPEHLERARESLRRAQALDPEAPEVRIASACVASCCDRAGDAGLAALRMISPAPHLTAAVAELETDILRRQGKWSESGVVLERAARLESGDAHVRRELAFNYSVLGLHGDALSCIDAAIAIAPDDLANYVEKSGCLRRSGRLAEAREALEAMPGVGGRNSERGWFCQEMAEGDFGGAVARARSLAREADAPTDPREHPALLLAQALSSAGEPAEARGRFEEVRAWAEERLRTVPDNSRLLQVQALSLAGLGKRAEAVAVARRAVEIAPPSLDAVEAALALESLTEVLVAVGDPEGAVDGLKMLLAAPSRLSLAILETDSKWGAVRLSPRIEELRRLALRPTP
jgi:tetratricopeptide (TPR) repeat protein